MPAKVGIQRQPARTVTFWIPAFAGMTSGLLPALAQAHGFGRSYNLPVPLWLYAWGAAAALLLSFLLMGLLDAAHGQGAPRRFVFALPRRLAVIGPVARGAALALLLLAIVSGLVGTADPYRNFNMGWFWIVFTLGLAWWAALIGNPYDAINPWRGLSQLVSRFWPSFDHGRWPYPTRLACWPALVLYMAFIWVELFGRTTPHSLSLLLLGYTALNLLAVWLVGSEAWFRHGEFFGLFFRLLGRMAPLHRVEANGPAVALQAPFAGLQGARAEDWSVVLVVLFMLSSTAFDGLHATEPWYRLFWSEALSPLRALAGTHPTEAYPRLRAIHLGFETFVLLISPLIYLAAYLICLALAKRLAGSSVPVGELALRFAFTLLPIAFVYHLSHYFTLLLTEGPRALPLLLDPLGRGWTHLGMRPLLPDMAWVWHSQVALIVIGHVASVYLAHVEALRLFGTRRAALLSQLPMLLLMMGLTVLGLWILALPIQAGG